MCIGEEGALQEQNVRLLLCVVNTMSLIGVSFFLILGCSCDFIHKCINLSCSQNRLLFLLHL
jgi:hypothetical protein